MGEEYPVGVPRIECTCIGDVEKAQMLEAFHIAKVSTRKHIERVKEKYVPRLDLSKERDKIAKEVFLDPLIGSHERTIERIETLDKAIREIPTCPIDWKPHSVFYD